MSGTLILEPASLLFPFGKLSTRLENLAFRIKKYLEFFIWLYITFFFFVNQAIYFLEWENMHFKTYV